MLKISSFSIDGFGNFQGFNKSFENSNFILIFGQNEAGKSTLFSFLRGIISGFPSSRQIKENKYNPLKGGEHGGSFILDFNNTKVKITSYVKDKSTKYEFISGDNKSFDDLTSFLKTLERNHYKSIFAFDLDELTALSTLDDDTLSETLFSSAITGSAAFITECSNELKEYGKELLKPKSKGSLQLLDEMLSSIRSKKRALLLEQNKADDLIIDIKNCENELINEEKLINVIESKIKFFEEQNKASYLNDQLSEIRILISDIKSKRIPSEDDCDYFYSLKARKEMLFKYDSDSNLDNLNDLETDIDSLVKRKQSLLKINDLFEELQNTNSEFLLYNENSHILLKKEKFYLLSLIISLLFSALFFYFSIIEYSLSFLFFSLISFILFIKSKRSINSLKLNIINAKDNKELISNKLSELTKEFDISEVSENEIEMQSFKISRELENSKVRYELLKDKIETAQSLKDNLVNEEKEFLQSFSCNTIEAFEERIKLVDKLKELEAREDELLRLKNNSANSTETIEIIHNKIDNNLNLSTNIEDLNTQKNKIKNNISLLQLKLSKLKVHVENILQGDSLEDCMFEEESIENSFRDNLNEWRSTVLANDLIEKSLHKLVEKNYIDVIKNASKIFSNLTNQSYSEILVHKKKNEISVLSNAGLKKDLKDLSRGTVEQLYLSIRLSLAIYFGKNFYQLPILLDDILVNFDKNRAINIIQTLVKISEQHQVFFFTCHEWVRELLLQSNESICEIKL